MTTAVVRAATHRDRLRAATRLAHEQVDTRFGRFDLATRHGYRGFLAAHSSVLPALEAQLSLGGAGDMLADWSSRLRAPALAADVHATGGDVAAVAVEPRTFTPAELMGMLYVLEGSRLGGAVLARRVAQNPDPDCRDATAYLRHGERRGLWPSFVAVFDASPHVRDHLDDTIHGALAAFALFAGVSGTEPRADAPS